VRSQADVHLPAQAAQALGWVEGWRGEVLVALQLSADGRITAATAMTRRGRTGRCWNTPSSATSFRTSRSSTSPSTSATRGTISDVADLRQIARTGIVTEPPPAVDAAVLAESRRIQDELLSILGQALAIRQVDAGSCNGCELEIHALNNAYYNLEGLGIRFVASPRHADMLLVTGPVSRHMEEALRRTYEATPEPRLVVAVGDCGADGGIFGCSYASCGGVAA
jgi:Ni,Fe-hydrogenase III small subunit